MSEHVSLGIFCSHTNSQVRIDYACEVLYVIAAERQRGSSLILTFQFRMRLVNLVPVFRPSYILSKSRFVSVVLWR